MIDSIIKQRANQVQAYNKITCNGTVIYKKSTGILKITNITC